MFQFGGRVLVSHLDCVINLKLSNMQFTAPVGPPTSFQGGSRELFLYHYDKRFQVRVKGFEVIL
jgi:hypothetical protein